MKTIQFKIVTPEKIVYQNEVLSATIPTMEGEITILPKHIPLVAVLNAGELRIQTPKGNGIFMAVSGGLVKVNKKEVIILADTAELAEEIDEERAKKARDRAKKLLQDVKNKEMVDHTALVAKINKELARLKVAGKQRKRFGPQITSNN